MMGLTLKQRELLDFIGERIATDGVCPSFEEMKDAMGLHSKSGIHRLLEALEERGFINRMRHRNRAIEILETPRPILKPAPPRPLIAASTGDLTFELQRRGFLVLTPQEVAP